MNYFIVICYIYYHIVDVVYVYHYKLLFIIIIIHIIYLL